MSIHVAPLAEPSDLPSGKVDSDPNTPTNICPAFEVFAPDARAYLVKSPKGQVPVIRVSTEELSEETKLQAEQKRKAEIRRSISPTGVRDFTGKMRTVGNRRKPSEDSRYPASRVTKAIGVREDRADSADRIDDLLRDESGNVQQRPAKRGPDGKFRRQ